MAVEIDAQTGVSRERSTTGRPLKPRHSPTEQRRLLRAQDACRRFEERWSSKAGGLLGDPRLLQKCLGEAEALPKGVTPCWQGDYWLHRLSHLTRALSVTEEGLRAALELVALWPLPSQLAEDEEPLTPGARHVRAAMWYSVMHDALGVHAAVRGFAPYGWRQPLPWSVLHPLRALKGYDDSHLVGGTPAGYGQPQEISYRALPLFQRAYADINAGLRMALTAIERVSDWESKARTSPLAKEVTGRYFRVGDRIFALPLLLDIESALRNDFLPRVHAQKQMVEQLAGNRPKIAARGGAAVSLHRQIAAQLVHRISAAVPDTRRRLIAKRETDSKYEKHGAFRAEVLQRAAAIMKAVYGVVMSPTDLKAAAQKHRHDARFPLTK